MARSMIIMLKSVLTEQAGSPVTRRGWGRGPGEVRQHPRSPTSELPSVDVVFAIEFR
jgi:hypothetical protein